MIGKTVYWVTQTLPTAQAPKSSIWLPLIVSANATPLPQATPIPPTATPQPSPTASLGMQALPLAVGNTWVYSATYYSDQWVITPATYIITDTVIMTQTYNGLFGAEIQRTSLGIDGSPGDGYIKGMALEYYFSGIYSYVISNTQIYRQDELDLPNLKTQTPFGSYKYPLMYDLPFKNESGFNCWYSGLWGETDCRTETRWSGYQYVADGPINLYKDEALSTMHDYAKATFERDGYSSEELTLAWKNYLTAPPQFPVVDFKDCYIISVANRESRYNQWFCLGIGIVHIEWLDSSQNWPDHAPKGLDINLISYSIAK